MIVYKGIPGILQRLRPCCGIGVYAVVSHSVRFAGHGHCECLFVGEVNNVHLVDEYQYVLSS